MPEEYAMTPWSRRRVLRDLSVASAAALTASPLRAFAPAKSAATTCTPTGSPDLYLIVSGPWLFMVQPPGIRAVTIDDSYHTYLAGELPPGSRFPQVSMSNGQDVSLAMTWQTGPPTAPISSLIAPMATNDTGLVYAAGVTPVSSPPVLRSVTLPTPTAITPLALLTNANYFTFTPSDLRNAQGIIAQWPSALAFIYRGWNTATFTSAQFSSPIVITNDNTTPTHIQFRIMMNGTMPADHAHAFFGNLMKLLSFPSGNPPSVNPPTQTVCFTLGNDPNILPCELGLQGSGSCLTPIPPSMAAGVRIKQGSAMPRSGPLVNCAGGGGGISGCGC
jgi:hypothetical protein